MKTMKKLVNKKTASLLLGLGLVTFNGYGQQCTWSCSNGGVSPSNTWWNVGKVGIGNSSPNYALDVTNGDINIATVGNCLRFDNNVMLSFDNTQSSIFLGDGAGTNNTNTSVLGNTFIGANSGHYNTTGAYNVFYGGGAGYGDAGGCTGGYNTFVGYNSGLSISTGSYNSAFGYAASYSNTTGYNNTAMGYQSLQANQTGYNNVAVGYNAMPSATNYNNTAIGNKASYSLTTGVSNTSVGNQASYSTTTGSYNTSLGNSALGDNSTGSDNTAIGYAALYGASTSSNTACGYKALYNNSAGTGNTSLGYYAGESQTGSTFNYNTFVGYNADATSTYSNCAAIGYNASATANDKMYFGNANTVGCYNATGTWGTTSDGRFKTNVTENVKGLAFINKLRPVTYNFDTRALDNFITQNLPDSIKTLHDAMDFSKSTAIVHSGFIAQEVEQAAQQVNFTSSIVSHPSSSTEPYALGYAELVVPLVKAVQELSTKDSLKTVAHKQDSLRINRQDSTIAAMQRQINQIVNTCCNNGSNNRQIQNNGSGSNGNSTTDSSSKVAAINVQLSNANVIVLGQNQPNPFAEQTIITYNIPQTANAAQILFYDVNGKQINSVAITSKGAGQLNVYANDLSNGMYSYTLIVDGQIIDTKKMVKQQ